MKNFIEILLSAAVVLAFPVILILSMNEKYDYHVSYEKCNWKKGKIVVSCGWHMEFWYYNSWAIPQLSWCWKVVRNVCEYSMYKVRIK